MTKPIIMSWSISQPHTWEGPADPDNFAELFMFRIGSDDGVPGSDWFDIEVVTPAWLAQRLGQGKGFAFGHGMLVVPRWDPELVVRAVQAACDEVPKGDWGWDRLTEHLCNYFYHEYDAAWPAPGDDRSG